MDCSETLTTTHLRDLLSSKGVRPSFQRISILKYLVGIKGHPSVDTIYQCLQQEIPTLSRTTVYNTLNLLIDKKVITALKINNQELIYDFMEQPHAHFQCRSCTKIYDVDIGADIYDATIIGDHLVFETQVYYKGICKQCRI